MSRISDEEHFRYSLMTIILSLPLFLFIHVLSKTELQVQPKSVKRLCKVHNIITVNGQFPGPTLEVRDGDSLVIKVVNAARYNVSLHW